MVELDPQQNLSPVTCSNDTVQNMVLKSIVENTQKEYDVDACLRQSYQRRICVLLC